MQVEDTKKRPDPFDPRIGTGRESQPNDASAQDDPAAIDDDEAQGEEPGDGKELGG